jgi:hypothetical protein
MLQHPVTFMPLNMKRTNGPQEREIESIIRALHLHPFIDSGIAAKTFTERSSPEVSRRINKPQMYANEQGRNFKGSMYAMTRYSSKARQLRGQHPSPPRLRLITPAGIILSCIIQRWSVILPGYLVIWRSRKLAEET